MIAPVTILVDTIQPKTTAGASGFAAMFAFIDSPDWWKLFFILPFIAIPSLAFVLYKFNIKLNMGTLFNKNKNINDSLTKMDSKIEDVLASINKTISSLTNDNKELTDHISNIHSNITKAMTLEKRMLNELSDIKAMYTIQIEQMTDTKIVKALEYLDEWLTTSLINNIETNLNDRCSICKSISLTSSIDNLAMSLKEDFRRAFDNNGFIKLNQEKFEEYVTDKCFTFRKTIRETLKKYYIHPTHLENLIKSQDSAFEKVMTKIDSEFYNILDSMRERENKMFEKMDIIEQEYTSEMKLLFPNMTVDSL